MQFALAVGLLGAVQAAALPASSVSSTTAQTTSKLSGRPAFNAPVAAADTNVTIVDLGITPALRRIEVKPNPNFTPNVTNVVLAAHAKYVVIEEAMLLEKRGRPVFNAPAVATTAAKAAGRPAFNAPVAGATSSSRVTSTSRSTTALSTTKSTSTSTSTSSLSIMNSLYTSTSSSTSSKPTTSSSTSTSTSISSTSTSTSTSSTSTSTSSSTSTTSRATTSTTPTSTSTSSSTSSSTSTPTSTSTTKSSTSTTTSSKTSSISSLATLTLAATNIQLDSEFLSEIKIGSNGDTIDVVMDTGSSDLWMFSSDCTDCSGSHDYYYPGKSTTFINTTTPFSLGYGDGSSTSGLLGFDTVTLGGVPIQGQNIDVAHIISASLQSNAMSGIMGLGFPNLMAVQQSGLTTPITNMFKQNLLPAAKFGLQYIKSNHWSYTGGGGAWTFGGIDTSVIRGALTTVKLTQAAYWKVALDSISVGSAYSYAPTQQVIVDSGTTLILLDSASVARIHAYLPGGRVSPDNSHYQIFCNASDVAYKGSRNAYFQLGGVKYGVPASDLAWYPESSAQDYCYSGIQPWGGSFGILGVMFLKNVYAVFDQTNQQMQFGARTDVAALTD